MRRTVRNLVHEPPSWRELSDGERAEERVCPVRVIRSRLPLIHTVLKETKQTFMRSAACRSRLQKAEKVRKGRCNVRAV